MRPIAQPVVLRFGRFELDLRTGELRKGGDAVKLAPQPSKVLMLLARRSGEIVSRDDIRQQIWSGGTFVDFDQGLNFCIRQIREALADDAEAPQYIETLPRRGYRFLLPVDANPTAAGPPVTRLIVLPFRMLKPDSEMDFLAFGLADAITSSLAGLESMLVRSSMVASRFAEEANPKAVAAEADVDVVLTGSLLRSGSRLRVNAQLTEVPAGTLLWAQTSEVALGDLFQAQDDLATRIVESLALPLTVREQTQLTRDIPSTARAYELYLRGNQLSREARHWAAARDCYLRCVDEDPGYAPAWTRLGRMHHVMAKWSAEATAENLDRAAVAFKRALSINPDHPLAHKFYAQLELDCGHAEAAMVRLLERARSADPELFAGLVSGCRYCGLLDASIAADARARRVDPKVTTSVVHTWFVRGEHARVVETKLEENPYIVALSFDAVGRTGDALALMRNLEGKLAVRKGEFMIVARMLLEGKVAESLAAARRIATSDFPDPEGLFYMARHLAHLDDFSGAIDLFGRVVESGFACYPQIATDPWLDRVRARPEFAKILNRAETQHRRAASAFKRLHGDALLGPALS